ncbi:hypothetical protein F4824DRAFT_504947 [Ustulina deusta]|nr:hypothetical protein F4824DRAFT_504947 [Ustulina deusta]
MSVSKTKQASRSTSSLIRSLEHVSLFPRPCTRDDIITFIKDLPQALNLTPMEQAMEDTLSYESGDPLPPFDIIPANVILTWPWRGGEYHVEHVSPPSPENLSTASTRTLTSQCAGNPRWECERFAAFLRAKNIAFDNTNTSVVVLARPNDPWKIKGDTEHAALIQVVGSLITTLAMYLPKHIPWSITSKLTERNIFRFCESHDLDAGLAVLSAFPPLELDGRTLFLIVDLSDVQFSEDNISNNHRSLIDAVHKIVIRNEAMLLRVNDTNMGIKCYTDGLGGTHEYKPNKIDVSVHDKEP